MEAVIRAILAVEEVAVLEEEVEEVESAEDFLEEALVRSHEASVVVQEVPVMIKEVARTGQREVKRVEAGATDHVVEMLEELAVALPYLCLAREEEEWDHQFQGWEGRCPQRVAAGTSTKVRAGEEEVGAKEVERARPK